MSLPPEDSAESLQQQMKALRRELIDDVEGVVDNARDLADWKHYVHSYPWLCLGAAAMVGYMVVPQKVNIISPSSKQLAALARKNQLVVHPSSPSASDTTWRSKALTLASNLAVRALLAYAGQRLGKFTGHEAAEAAEESDRAAAAGPPGAVYKSHAR